MTEVTIRRTPTIDSADEVAALLSYAFQATPPIKPPEDEEFERWRRVSEGTETFLALVGDTAAASACSVPMTHNVRGTLTPMWGLWGVASHPAYRRAGYARRAIFAMHEAAYEAGAAFVTLYPFRASFYQRLGYIRFPQPLRATLDMRSLTPLLKRTLPGAVELSLAKDGFDTFRAIMREHLSARHGMALADGVHPSGWMRENDNQWIALARVEGEVRGVMVYRIEGKEYRFDLNARHFYAFDSAGRYLLLEWLARHIDQIKEFTLTLAPDETPDTWWIDMDTRLEGGYAPMGRVLNVTRIGGIATGPGAFVARISDDFCPWNEGVFRFESVEGALNVTPGGDPDCDLTIQGLSALIYGTHPPDSFVYRGWGDPSPATQAAMLAMFPPALPHLHETF